MSLEVFAPGSKVQLGKGGSAKVLSVQIRTNHSVSYRVAWWDGTQRNDEWLEACEVSQHPEDKHTIKMGFKA